MQALVIAFPPQPVRLKPDPFTDITDPAEALRVAVAFRDRCVSKVLHRQLVASIDRNNYCPESPAKYFWRTRYETLLYVLGDIVAHRRKEMEEYEEDRHVEPGDYAEHDDDCGEVRL